MADIDVSGTDIIAPLAGDVYFVKGEHRGKFPSCNGLLLNGTETVLIDAGMGRDVITEVDCIARIDTVILSHSHPDHIRHGFMLEDRRLIYPKETPASVADLNLLGERFIGTPEGGSRWAGLVREVFDVSPLRLPDDRYEHGTTLDFGSVRLRPIHAPGHLDDHYCFFEEVTETLFTTDIDLTRFGPWYGNPESHVETFKQSIRAIMTLPYQRVCTSHREPLEGDARAEFEAFLAVFDRHQDMILQYCGTPVSVDDIAAQSPFYRNGLPDRVIQHAFEARMISKIMEALVTDGRVTEVNGRYVRAS
jgi:glyoxylase-like metal-dependent hydrolase (beta-lactamase superfamily II)